MTDESWAIGGLTALGFPDGAESGAKKGNLRDVDHLHALGVECVALFLHQANAGVSSE